MGAIRKLTGVQSQIDAANRNARVQEEAAQAAAKAAAEAAQVSAQSAANQQRNAQEREQIQADIAGRLAAPESADVQLGNANDNSSGATRRRRATFGRNYGSSVSI